MRFFVTSRRISTGADSAFGIYSGCRPKFGHPVRRGCLVSSETLHRAQDLLLVLLDRSMGPMDPSELLEAATREPAHPSAEDLRIALWSLLGNGVVARGDDNTLTRVNQAAAPANGAAAMR